MVICTILGTRPEIIKMSPVLRECERRDLPFYMIHTGQHYDYEMDQTFFDDLELPEPEYKINVGSWHHGEQTGRIMAGVEKILLSRKDTSITLVQGDTNTVLAGALASVKIPVKVGHVEAGLRSFDRSMPEEINRLVADHLSDLLFAPTNVSKNNLLREGIAEEKIYVTGNTVVDAVYQNVGIAKEKSNVLDRLGLSPQEYIAVTAHRAENVDNEKKLKNILEGIRRVSKHFDMPVVYPVHPRTQKMMLKFSASTEGITTVEPLGYLDFLLLEAKSWLILTDSGGIQEEACILKVPCVTLRENTERPETLEVSSNMLAGTAPEEILKASIEMAVKPRKWKNPFGEGESAKKIIQIYTNSDLV